MQVVVGLLDILETQVGGLEFLETMAAMVVGEEVDQTELLM
jgi:hypothetical protein